MKQAKGRQRSSPYSFPFLRDKLTFKRGRRARKGWIDCRQRHAQGIAKGLKQRHVFMRSIMLFFFSFGRILRKRHVQPHPPSPRMQGCPWSLFLSILMSRPPLIKDVRGSLINFLFIFLLFVFHVHSFSFSLTSPRSPSPRSFLSLTHFAVHPSLSYSLLLTTLALLLASSKIQPQLPKMFWTCQPAKKRKDTDKLTRTNAFAPCNRVLAIPELRDLLYSFIPSGLPTTTTTTNNSNKTSKGASCMLVCRHWKRYTNHPH